MVVDIYTSRYLETLRSPVKGGELFRNKLTPVTELLWTGCQEGLVLAYEYFREAQKKPWVYAEYAGVAQG
jgi:hypothetical protein